MPPPYEYPYDLNLPPRQPLAPTSINSLLNPAPANDKTYHIGRPAIGEATSTKRKADEYDEDDDEEDSDDGVYVTQNCDQIRRKIHAFINSGEMKVGEFQKAIGVNSKGYGMFMGQSGRDKGSGSNTYIQALKFFKKREEKGLKIGGPKRKAKTADGANSNVDLDSIRLEGEEDISVPIFDSCDEIRKKIRAYLAGSNGTQADFLRAIAKPYNDGRKIQSKVLNDFLGKKGAYAGNTSAVFYGAYVFFEKMRIRDGKPKSKHRLDMERVHGSRGLDTKRRRDHVWCLPGERPYEDRLGQIHFEGR
ncbi:hypothetical protein ONS95_011825 [Cadophora gregata]|uniref:uncharacterized protein n=1 Tax=Cadophora gregata TaxID=51156 RepID=UPI0026DBBE59|nr:uncharacterized protein ONS95_011825 [Cadophora gregata]KAK0117485.1 hypothetical protein ONS95_011825 [Cadophora gregata]KAK0122540.1 hypothetical protein ONS96_009582 [Cadophora gregata f. sp. sojae]